MSTVENIQVSIVTVCYNAEKVIEKTIQSVLSQTYTNFEYIIKDGGSNDATNDIINKYAVKFKERNIQFVHMSCKDSGIYDAMNQATAIAAGKYINYMNADDTFYDSHVLERIFKECYHSEDILYGDSVCEYEFVRGKKEYTLWHGQDEDFKRMPFSHQACFFKNALIKDYLYDIHYKSAADYNALARAKSEGKKFAYIKTIVSLCTMDGVSNVNIKQSYLETIEIKKKWGLVEFAERYEKISITIMQVKQWILRCVPRRITGHLLRWQVKRSNTHIYSTLEEIKG